MEKILALGPLIPSSIADILKYGGIGLSSIVCLLAFWLLYQQSTKAKPNRSMLNAIKTFMAFAILLVIIPLFFDTIQKPRNVNLKTVRLTGTIKDSLGIPMNNVSVYLVPKDNLKTETNDMGTFVFDKVPSEEYWTFVVNDMKEGDVKVKPTYVGTIFKTTDSDTIDFRNINFVYHIDSLQ